MKSPLLGTVKSRLAAEIGAAAALESYLELLAITVGALRECPDVEVRFTPDGASEEARRWVLPRWEVRPQGTGDLGQRLEVAFADAFAAGADRVAAIGSDCPDITPLDFVTAEQLLAEHDLVLGPATDGGYWLIAMNRSFPVLFREIDWSTDRVLAQTISAAQAHGIRIASLRTLSDVDTRADWEAWKVTNSTSFSGRLEPKTPEF